jgi:hypothetical protein
MSNASNVASNIAFQISDNEWVELLATIRIAKFQE